MRTALWVGLGSALGGMARHWIALASEHHFGRSFPVGTLVVNVVGCFLIGFAATAGSPEGRLFLLPIPREFFLIGVLGGFTTFSSFSFQTLSLARNGDWVGAALNVTLSLVLCLAAVWFGFYSARMVSR